LKLTIFKFLRFNSLKYEKGLRPWPLTITFTQKKLFLTKTPILLIIHLAAKRSCFLFFFFWINPEEKKQKTAAFSR